MKEQKLTWKKFEQESDSMILHVDGEPTKIMITDDCEEGTYTLWKLNCPNGEAEKIYTSTSGREIIERFEKDFGYLLENH